MIMVVAEGKKLRAPLITGLDVARLIRQERPGTAIHLIADTADYMGLAVKNSYDGYYLNKEEKMRRTGPSSGTYAMRYELEDSLGRKQVSEPLSVICKNGDILEKEIME